jgi:hypothetical protein
MLRHIKLFINGEFENNTFLFVRVSKGWVGYGLNETAPRSSGGGLFVGRANHVRRQFSRVLCLDGHPNRLMVLNMWQDEAVFNFWRQK